MKVRIVFANKRFILNEPDPTSLMMEFLDKIKSIIDKEFPRQYLIQHMEYSVTADNQTLSFSCKTVSKELENNNHHTDIENLLTKPYLKKIFNMGTTFNINDIAVIPTRKILAFEQLDVNIIKIDPYFVDYCVRHESYCKEMLKRDIQYITVEYEQTTKGIECCTGKFEEKYIKDNQFSNKNNMYHLFAAALLYKELRDKELNGADALKNKLLSSGIRSVLMINKEDHLIFKVHVSADEEIYPFFIKKSNLLLSAYSESCPLLSMSVFATKINGVDPDPEERKYRLLSSSNYF
jgi:hypothetical protein